MKHYDFSSIAMEHVDYICYMSDMDTYDLLYLNKAGLETFKIEDDYYGKKCYKVLQGNDKPCDFCTNHLLNPSETYRWEICNNILKKTYELIDTMMLINGRNVRMEIAFDVSERAEKITSLQTKLSTEETLIKCIQTLKDAVDIEDALDSLLHIVGEYYNSKRAYIFEFDYRSNVLNNTYEWCENKAESEKENLQNIPLENISDWIEKFEKDGEFFITSLEQTYDENHINYKILNQQNIESLLAAPLISKDKIVGFIGVDNPKREQLNLKLLRSTALFVLDDLKKRRMRKELEILSFVDALTGAYNRNKFNEYLKELEIFPPEKIGVIYADINGLKQANDTYGHAFGDGLIVAAASTLKRLFGEFVFRAGGDEFIVLCPNIDECDFDALITELRTYVDATNDINISIGHVWKCGNIDVSKEIAYSDDLMYAEKQSYYKSMLSSRLSQTSSAARDLLHEIESGQFEVFLQAKVRMSTGKINGAEALVRKKAPDGTFVSPVKFILEYERNKIIRHIDFFVLETVCRTLQAWIKSGYPIQISINFSRVTFMEHNVVSEIENICKKYGVPTEYIDIEITESNDKIDNSLLTKKMRELKDIGFTISLDDFGAHYSNLLMLTTSEFSQVKIDKSLVDKLTDNHKNRLVIEHAIKLVQSLNCASSLAEGIETEEQLEILKHFNCDMGQGFLFSEPLPIEEFLKIYLEQL